MELYRNAFQSHGAAQQELQDWTTPIKEVMIHAFPKDNLELMQAQIASGDLSGPHQSYMSCAQSPAQSRSGGSSPEEGHRGMRKRICHTCDQPKLELSREKSL